MPQLNLIKGHGCGVDVVVIDAAPAAVAEDGLEPLVRRLCDRRGPVGAEGVYFVDDEGDAADEPRVWSFGPDGTAVRGGAYGVGVVGRVLLDRRDIEQVAIRLDAGRFDIRRSDDSAEGARRVSVEGPSVEFGSEAVGRIVPAFGERRSVTAVAVPEPQLVSIVGRYDEDELIEVARRVAADRVSFPDHPGVSFVMPLAEADEVFVRTYEYGVGVSRSSAPGVVAARAAYSRLGVIPAETSVLVRTPGGPVRATLRVEGTRWLPVLEANATLTYDAVVDAELLAATQPIALDLRANVGEVMAYAALRSANARALEAAGVRYSAP
jgi:diaminopimelate epimerase